MMDDFAKKILNDVNLEEIAPRVKDRSPVDHWSPAVLLERAAYLRKMARYGDGSANEVIKEFPHYSAVLSVLGRTGDAEVHHDYTCFVHVLAGAASLVTGGTVNGARSAGAGEVRGSSIKDGARQELRQGDFVHVPAGVPHQFLIAGDKAITCLIVKIQELN
jgi:mannose-6-phosphate isomerase-like protein (cupin superfamily)